MADKHNGTRWELAYGTRDGIEGYGTDQLHRAVSRFLPYTVRVAPAEGESTERECHRVVTGTRHSNQLIAQLAQHGALDIPDTPESYHIRAMDSPWAPGTRLLVAAGSDSKGLTNAAMALAAHHLYRHVMPDNCTPSRLRAALDGIEDFSITSNPHIAHRGIWCWGYTIYDYRRFVDNMAHLRMNMLTIWNDVPPVNCAEVIDYAHGRGVKVVLGFAWGWGQRYDLADRGERERLADTVAREFERHYCGLDMDGVYFQTLTEHHDTHWGDRTVAATVCDTVNATAARLLELSPELPIQFGLHATSIMEHCTDLQSLDPRVTIVWEDGGVIPYSYSPTPNTTTEGENFATKLDTPELTLDYSRKLAVLRPGTPFGIVPKGWPCILWGQEFEHHDSYLLGERSPEWIRRRLALRQPRWDKVNALWLQNYHYAVTFYREMLGLNPTGMIVTALVEDALFEERIQPSVALLAEMLWDPWREPSEILDCAMSSFYG